MTDTTVKYFDSEMPGAAQLSGTAGALVAILRECLVTGRGLASATVAVSGGVATASFASGHPFVVDAVALVAGAAVSAINGEHKITSTSTNTVTWDAPGVPDGAVSGTITIKLAPAGWEEVFTATNKTALRSSDSGSTRCVLRVDDTGAGSPKYARLRSYESMTDIDTGTGPSPSESVCAGGWYIPKSNAASTAARRWILLADARRAVLMVASDSTYQDGYWAFAFGDAISDKSGDAWHFLTTGLDGTSYLDSYAGATAHAPTHRCARCSLQRSYSQVGGAVQCRTWVPGAIAADSGSNSNPVGPSVVNNAIDVSPILLQETLSDAGPVRGRFPGLYHVPLFLGAGYGSKSAIAATQGLAGRKLMAVGTYMVGSGGGQRFFVDITGPWD